MNYLNLLNLIVQYFRAKFSKPKTTVDLNDYGIRELRVLANGKVKGFMRMRKEQLILELQPFYE